MNCFKEFLFIFLLHMILSAFHIEHLTGKKEILRKGTCFEWFEIPQTESSDSPMWSTDSEKVTCTICNPTNTKKSWLTTKMVNTEGYGLIHADVNIFRRQCENCKNQDVKVLILNQTLPIRDKKKSLEILNKLRVLTTLQNKEDDKSQAHYFQFQPTSSKFSIVFLSEGSCTRVETIEVSSFVCETNISNAVYLPRTVAPVSGFTRVNVSCSENTLNPRNMEAYGLCSSEGIWKIMSPCMCKKGFTLAAAKEGCKECEVNTYKDDVGNGKCYACPLNSRSGTGQRQCLCENGFYRFMGDNFTRPCHGIPSEVRKIRFTDRTETSITLLWEPPERSGAPDQHVLYDVECKKCQSGSDSMPCEGSCGTRVLYIPRQSNLTNTNVTIQNLDQDTVYKFFIYSKNLNSSRINKSNWEYSTKKIKTEVSSAKSKSSISTILVGVSVSVIFLLIVSCGIFRKHRGRHQTPKVSNSEFPVEQTQNNEEPHYETPDELGIAPYEEVPNLIRSDEIRPETPRGETNTLHDEKPQILELSAYAELDKNRQDQRDNCDYQKLLKRDSDYLIPDDGGKEAYENSRMEKLELGYKELDRAKRY